MSYPFHGDFANSSDTHCCEVDYAGEPGEHEPAPIFPLLEGTLLAARTSTRLPPLKGHFASAYLVEFPACKLASPSLSLVVIVDLPPEYSIELLTKGPHSPLESSCDGVCTISSSCPLYSQPSSFLFFLPGLWRSPSGRPSFCAILESCPFPLALSAPLCRAFPPPFFYKSSMLCRFARASQRRCESPLM